MNTAHRAGDGSGAMMGETAEADSSAWIVDAIRLRAVRRHEIIAESKRKTLEVIRKEREKSTARSPSAAFGCFDELIAKIA
jgi:hypothetical protein